MIDFLYKKKNFLIQTKILLLSLIVSKNLKNLFNCKDFKKKEKFKDKINNTELISIHKIFKLKKNKNRENISHIINPL